ncbi:MAG: hypothetical protein Tsb007_14820 [Rhizobacter sp.]
MTFTLRLARVKGAFRSAAFKRLSGVGGEGGGGSLPPHPANQAVPAEGATSRDRRCKAVRRDTITFMPAHSQG